MAEAATVPSWGAPALPKNSYAGSMIPGSWTGRGVNIDYTGGDGKPQTARCKLLDVCGLGVVVALAGGRCVIPWGRVTCLELRD